MRIASHHSTKHAPQPLSFTKARQDVNQGIALAFDLCVVYYHSLYVYCIVLSPVKIREKRVLACLIVSLVSGHKNRKLLNGSHTRVGFLTMDVCPDFAMFFHRD